MKKTLALLFVLSLALIAVACVPMAKYYTCPDGRQVLDPKNCEESPVTEPVVNEPSTPATTEPVPVVIKDITPDAQALFDKSKKATTIKFSYYDSSDPFVENIYRASRDKLKVELKNKAYFNPTEIYDTVYYDFADLSSFGYCERQSISTCLDRNKKVTVTFEEYIVRTPFDWLNGIEKAELTGKSKMIDGRTGKEISFQLEGKQGSMFVDSFFGMPLSITYDGVTYEYKNAAINEGTVNDLVHQELVNN